MSKMFIKIISIIINMKQSKHVVVEAIKACAIIKYKSICSDIDYYKL